MLSRNILKNSKIHILQLVTFKISSQAFFSVAEQSSSSMISKFYRMCHKSMTWRRAIITDNNFVQKYQRFLQTPFSFFLLNLKSATHDGNKILEKVNRHLQKFPFNGRKCIKNHFSTSKATDQKHTVRVETGSWRNCTTYGHPKLPRVRW